MKVQLGQGVDVNAFSQFTPQKTRRAREAFVRQLDFSPSAVAFDAAFDKKKGKSK